MKKIIVLQGPPASGKSTWARDTAKAGTPYVIVNRDSIREARGEYWIPEQETYISDLEFRSGKAHARPFRFGRIWSKVCS